jgi:hypothetical protein
MKETNGMLHSVAECNFQDVELDAVSMENHHKKMHVNDSAFNNALNSSYELTVFVSAKTWLCSDQALSIVADNVRC